MTEIHLPLGLNVGDLGRHAASWRARASEPERALQIDHYVEVARLAEHAGFDAVFLADGAVQGAAAGSIPYRFEPFELLAAMATETEKIGLIGTFSTSYNDPYLVAERATSLNELSAGRVAVNAVASAGDRIAQNFGLERQQEHGTRYARVDEFLRVLRAIWRGEEVGEQAFFAPYDGRRLSGTYAEPVLVQAGSSAQGREVAATHADVVYAASSSIETGRAFRSDVRARAASKGRDPDSIKVMPGVVPFVASTEKEALDLRHELDALHEQGVDVVAMLGGMLGVDLAERDPDAPFPIDLLGPHLGQAGGATVIDITRVLAIEERLSLREVAQRVHNGGHANIQWQVVGAPEQVAQELVTWYLAGAADGFNLMVPLQPSGLQIFADEVVPLLEQWGYHRSAEGPSTLRRNLSLGETA